MKKILLASIILFLSIIGYSQTFIVNGITYQVIAGTNNTVDAIDYNSASGSQVVIPKTVINSATNAKYSVVGIGTEAFQNKGLTSLTLSEGLITIGNKAFWNNQISGTLVIPNSVTTIKPNSFNVNAISSLDLGNGITYLQTQAFGNNQLTNITIPSSIQYMGGGVFYSNSITTVTIQDGASNLGARTFWDNPLVEVISESITPPIITTGGNEDTFNNQDDDRAVIDLIIPGGTTGSYVTDPSALWTGFKSVTENPALSVTDHEWINDLSITLSNDQIEIIASNDIKIQEYTLYDVSGNIITKGTKSTSQTIHIANGVYILKLVSNKGLLTKRIITNL